MANCLLPLVSSIVHPDQNGFIPGRATFLNTRRLCHIMGLVAGYESLPIAMSLDIEKAFDTLSWEYLWVVLEKLGIGPVFRRWVRLLYRATRTRVRTGCCISDSFQIHRGTRQGCPLSPIIFALAMGPLACWLRRRAAEWGIPEGE